MNTPKSWADISFNQFQQLHRIAAQAPNTYKDLQIATDEKEIKKLEEKLDFVELVKWQSKCVQNLAGLTDQQTLELDVYEDVIPTYEKVYNFVIAAMFLSPIDQAEECTKFKFEDETFYAPKSVVGLDGKDMPMRYSTLGEFFEANALRTARMQVDDGDITCIPKQLAYLYKKRGEKKLTDEQIDKRAEKFMKLSMDIVWGCTFFLISRRLTSVKDSLQDIAQIPNLLKQGLTS